MERVAHKATSHREADEWDVEQHVSMSPSERMRVARVLKERAYPGPRKDVRECHPSG